MKNEVCFTERQNACLAYRLHGDGPPVLFIQGINTHGGGWMPQVSELSRRFRCLTFDNRGLGQSTRGDAPITVEEMAGDALAILDAAGWESAHVVGHSLGGPVGLCLALTARHRVRSLALLCSFASGRSVGPLSWRLVWAGLRMQFGGRRVRRGAFLELLMPPGDFKENQNALAERFAPLFGHDLADQPPVVKEQMRAMRAFEATPRLYELAGLPTLVVSAEHDPIAPPALGRTLAAGIPGARFTELSGASHGVVLTEPDRVNELLVNHLSASQIN